MTRYILSTIIGVLIAITAFAQPNNLWTRTYGGPDYSEECNSLQQTTYGGFILAGYKMEFIYPNEYYDEFVVKTDANGDTLWTRTYGGRDDDVAYSVQQTSDGGYVIAGYTESFGAGGKDFFLVRTDTNGDTLWTETYGGTEDEICYSMIIADDGNYILAGYTESYGAGQADMYLLKVGLAGELIWEHTYGGTSWDECRSIQQFGGGFVLAGRTGDDIYLVETDGDGNVLVGWPIDIASNDCCNSVLEPNSNEYILGGTTDMFSAGTMFLLKCEWDYAFGGWYAEWIEIYLSGYYSSGEGKCIIQSNDGGYILAGNTDGYIPRNNNYSKIIKTDPGGYTQWIYQQGGFTSARQWCNSIIQTSDGDYVYGGKIGHSNTEMYLVKLAPDFAVELTYVSGSPVPSGGGDLNFDAYMSNESGASQNLDAWLDVEYGGHEPTTIAQRHFENVQPEWTLDRPGMFFPVPGTYAAGNYWLRLRVGVHPDTIWAEDQFSWEKSGLDKVAGFVPFIPDDMPDLFGEIDETGGDQVPADFALLGAHPNPFNPTTTISYQLPASGLVSLKVYDVQGKLVSVLVNSWRDAGIHEVTFDGSILSSGVYIYQIEAGSFTDTKKMILIK